MVTKRILALALVLPFLAGGALIPNPADAESKPTLVKAGKASKVSKAGCASDAPTIYRNDIIHRYHGGPKYPH